MAETVSLLNMKGGVGKTTLAVNLAYHIFKRGKKRVLLVDLDPQFNSSQYLMDYKKYGQHVRHKGTIADLLIDSPTLKLQGTAHRKPNLSKCLFRVSSQSSGAAHFDLLPSQLTLSHVVKNPAQMEFRLEKLLKPLQNEYDFIFIDCAPTDSVLTTMALTASNYLLIPVRPDRFSILGFGMVLDCVRHFRETSMDPNSVRDLGVVFTQVRNTSGVESECMDEVRTQATKRGSYVFASQLFFSNTFITAVQNQTPAFDTKYAREELKEAITGIVKEMRNRISEIKSEQEDHEE